MRKHILLTTFITFIGIFANTTAYAADDGDTVVKFAYMTQGDAYHVRMETETYKINYQGYFDLYYGTGMGMLRKRSDKTTVFTFYPHVGVRGYTAVAPFFETGFDALQIVFLPGKTYDFNYIDFYYKIGVSWNLDEMVGMDLFWQRHTALFQKGNPATFVGLSLYVKVPQE